eukprot:TRINITY_DN109362_c0_g1_i1.p1 TRINITY_DN109362_c0_g1~~TRINITY_DN109362_c0_g1_i1.p1  ORF type:complete len:348 (-),score=42.21 TRINITY_DN109362_c0_g1_i1:70-1113(-)
MPRSLEGIAFTLNDPHLQLSLPGANDAFDAFLAARPLRSADLVSFAQTSIKFSPNAAVVQEQEIGCEEDFAVCNRECERLFGERRAEMEEPCKLAVARHFTGGSRCFPANATVEELQKGRLRIRDVQVGDEIAVPGGATSRVVALLHADPEIVTLYLVIQYASAQIVISPEHLLWVRATSKSLHDHAPEASWSWRAAQDVRVGDALESSGGEAVTVQFVHRVCMRGAFAPLTESGQLLVNGIRCSCYSPPSVLRVRHELCHSVMMPLRALDAARAWLEQVSKPGDDEDPVLTLGAVWLLPQWDDQSLHPYAGGLLSLVAAAQVVSQRCGKVFGRLLAEAPVTKKEPC